MLADGGQIGGDDLVLQDYGQTAIVAQVRSEIARRGVAWERFTADGPLALLPFADGTLALVWTVPAARAPGLLEASGERFLAALGAQFGDRLGASPTPARDPASPSGCGIAGRTSPVRASSRSATPRRRCIRSPARV